LAEEILNHKIKDGDSVSAGLDKDNEKIIFKVKAAKVNK